jgi:signal transduction histidine kinase
MIMTEQAAPVLDGDPMEFPGGTHPQQRFPKAARRGMEVRRDLLTGHPAPDPQAGPAGSHADFAAVSARIIAAADEARRRIERDLHDGLQQRLVSLGLRAQLAQASVPADQRELNGELARIADGLAEALDTVREISRGIHPAILSEAGLGPAVEALARNSPVPVTLHSNVEGRLPNRVEVGAYYIISEALANAAKHAQATAVDISVGHRGHALDLSVRDDGSGGADGSGPGLTGLADRVHALAGTMQLVSPRGGGTRLRVRLPTGPGQLD